MLHRVAFVGLLVVVARTVCVRLIYVVVQQLNRNNEAPLLSLGSVVVVATERFHHHRVSCS